MMRTRVASVTLEGIDREGEQARVLVCLLNLDGVQLTGKGILVGCARMVRYFYAPTLAHGIVVKVDIGAFVEAMMWGLLGRWGDVVMDVCKAV